MKLLLLPLLLLLRNVAALTAPEEESIPAPDIRRTALSYAGNACPVGSVSASVDVVRCRDA
jgi:hypothetical protein